MEYIFAFSDDLYNDNDLGIFRYFGSETCGFSFKSIKDEVWFSRICCRYKCSQKKIQTTVSAILARME